MRVGILGPLEVDDDAGAAVQVGSGKQRALLAVLALHAGHAVSADRLVDELWDRAPLTDAGNALQHHVSRLRKLVGRDQRPRPSPLREPDLRPPRFELTDPTGS